MYVNEFMYKPAVKLKRLELNLVCLVTEKAIIFVLMKRVLKASLKIDIYMSERLCIPTGISIDVADSLHEKSQALL